MPPIVKNNTLLPNQGDRSLFVYARVENRYLSTVPTDETRREDEFSTPPSAKN
jgi:hypothetical protein